MLADEGEGLTETVVASRDIYQSSALSGRRLSGVPVAGWAALATLPAYGSWTPANHSLAWHSWQAHPVCSSSVSGLRIRSKLVCDLLHCLNPSTKSFLAFGSRLSRRPNACPRLPRGEWHCCRHLVFGQNRCCISPCSRDDIYDLIHLEICPKRHSPILATTVSIGNTIWIQTYRGVWNSKAVNPLTCTAFWSRLSRCVLKLRSIAEPGGELTGHVLRITNPSHSLPGPSDLNSASFLTDSTVIRAKVLTAQYQFV